MIVFNKLRDGRELVHTYILCTCLISTLMLVSGRDGSVSNLCRSGSRQCITVPISGLGCFLLGHRSKSNQMQKIWVKSAEFLQISGCFQYFKFSFNYYDYMC